MISKRIKVENLPYETRIDRWLAANHHIPVVLVQKLIRKKKILVNEKSIANSHKIQNGDVVEVKANLISNSDEPQKQTKNINSNLYKNLLERINDNIIFKDDYLIAINKPYGVAVQGGSKIKISVDDILDGLRFEYAERPRLVHRLDRHTSGVLILARTKESAKILTELFKTKQIEKKYFAVVLGRPKQHEGIIKSYMAKTKDDDHEKVSDTSASEGKQAITKYKVLENLGNMTLIEFMPITGRTHQIRVHAAINLGTPIIGDEKYGGKKADIQGIIESKLHLHAKEMVISGLKGKSYNLKADLPDHIMNTLRIFKS